MNMDSFQTDSKAYMLTANFCKARLQPCREARRINAALAAGLTGGRR